MPCSGQSGTEIAEGATTPLRDFDCSEYFRGSLLPGNLAGLILVVRTALLAEGAAGLTSNTWLLGALSFKSTSFVSFALAVASLSLAVERPTPEAISRPARLVCAVTPSILGSYVAQSIFTAAWHPAMDALCADALALGGEAALLLVGIVASVVLLAGVFAFDRLVRISVLRALGLA